MNYQNEDIKFQNNEDENDQKPKEDKCSNKEIFAYENKGLDEQHYENKSNEEKPKVKIE